jgi:hypothetical protein
MVKTGRVKITKRRKIILRQNGRKYTVAVIGAQDKMPDFSG